MSSLSSLSGGTGRSNWPLRPVLSILSKLPVCSILSELSSCSVTAIFAVLSRGSCLFRLQHSYLPNSNKTEYAHKYLFRTHLVVPELHLAHLFRSVHLCRPGRLSRFLLEVREVRERRPVHPVRLSRLCLPSPAILIPKIIANLRTNIGYNYILPDKPGAPSWPSLPSLPSTPSRPSLPSVPSLPV